MIGFVLYFFLRFHLKLISSNKTTIENLDHLKKIEDYKSVYDINPDVNFYQVFGVNKFMWPFPIYLNSGKPLGDGLFWPINIHRPSEVDDLILS